MHEEAAVKDHLNLAMERIKILEEKAFGAADSLDDSIDRKQSLMNDEPTEFDRYGRKIC